jgi:hypothetical protein
MLPRLAVRDGRSSRSQSPPGPPARAFLNFKFKFKPELRGLNTALVGAVTSIMMRRRCQCGQRHTPGPLAAGHLPGGQSGPSPPHWAMGSTLRRSGPTGGSLRCLSASGMQRRRVLAVLRVSEEHPGTLASASNLARSPSGQGKHAEAGVPAERTERRRRREVPGVRRWVLRVGVRVGDSPPEEHPPETLASASSLALSPSDQGKHAEGGRIKREVPGAQGRIPGSHNPSLRLSSRARGGGARAGPGASARRLGVTPAPGRLAPQARRLGGRRNGAFKF